MGNHLKPTKSEARAIARARQRLKIGWYGADRVSVSAVAQAFSPPVNQQTLSRYLNGSRRPSRARWVDTESFLRELSEAVGVVHGKRMMLANVSRRVRPEVLEAIGAEVGRGGQ